MKNLKVPSGHIFFLLCLSSVCHPACVAMKEAQSDDAHPEMGKKKIEYALSAIRNPSYQLHDRECVVQNMHYLGLTGSQRVIPSLIAELSYKIPPENPPQRLRSRGDEFPAIGSLISMGKSAIPSLIRVISEVSPSRVEHQNALYALMAINNANPDEGLKELKNASARESNPEAARRLQSAIQVARDTWCRTVTCIQ